MYNITYIDWRKKHTTNVIYYRTRDSMLDVIRTLNPEITYYIDITENTFTLEFIWTISDYIFESKINNVYIDVSDQKSDFILKYIHSKRIPTLKEYFIFDDQYEVKRLLQPKSSNIYKEMLECELLKNYKGSGLLLQEKMNFE